MGNLEQELIKTIEIHTEKLKNDPITAEFDKANKEFSSLVEKGLAKRRGNNLMPIEQIHLKRITFNSAH